MDDCWRPVIMISGPEKRESRILSVPRADWTAERPSLPSARQVLRAVAVGQAGGLRAHFEGGQLSRQQEPGPHPAGSAQRPIIPRSRRSW